MKNSDSTYRERFARTLAHQAVDRPPMDLGASDMTEIDGAPRRLAPLLGIPAGTPDLDEAVLQALDIDIRGVGGILAPPGVLAQQLSPTERTDAWGIRYTWNGHHYEITGNPLAGATLADLETYPWPDSDRLDVQQLAAIREQARWLREETPYVVCGRHPCYGILELGCWMCGFDDFLYRMAAEPEFVHRFFEIVLAYQRRLIDVYYGAIGPYLHFTTSGDDFGTQKGPFLSPAMFGELVAPYLERRIQATRRHTDAAFFHHSCGGIRPLIPELIRIGVQILNPVQPGAAGMEPEGLKQDFGGRLTFYGGVDTQHLLREGTPETVTGTVRQLIRALGAAGGYILSAAHTLQPDVPEANIVALFRAGRGG